MAETIGQSLKQARETHNLTIEKVVEAIHIRSIYIEALEADNFNAFPSTAQVRGFLKIYAEFLGLTIDELVARQRAESTPYIPVTKQEPAPEPMESRLTAPVGTGPVSEAQVEIVPVEPPPTQPDVVVKTILEPVQFAPIRSTPIKTELPELKLRNKRMTKVSKKMTSIPSFGRSITRKLVKNQPEVAKRREKKPTAKKLPTAKSTSAKRNETKSAQKSTKAAKTGNRSQKPSAKKTRKDSGTEPGHSQRSVQKPAAQKALHTALNAETKPEPKLSPFLGIAPLLPPESEQIQRQRFEPVESADKGLASPVHAEKTVSGAIENESLEPSGTGKPANHAPPVISRDIFISIGRDFRQRRELLSLTLNEIERQIHVRKQFLEAVEGGNFDLLPSSVQARGILNNYASILDMDADALLLRFADGLQAQRLERQPLDNEKPPHARFIITVPAFIRRFLTGDLVIGGGLVILLILFAIWGTSRILTLRVISTPQGTAPSFLDNRLISPTAGTKLPTTTQTGGPAPLRPQNLTQSVSLPTQGKGLVYVIVIALERTFMRVFVDGKVTFEGRTVPGNAYPFNGDKQIEVQNGNGSALKIIYNGTDMGVMGTFGEVVDFIYGIDVVMTPTMTPTPTSTITPTPTITPHPSITPRPSPTPRPSVTP